MLGDSTGTLLALLHGAFARIILVAIFLSHGVAGVILRSEGGASIRRMWLRTYFMQNYR